MILRTKNPVLSLCPTQSMKVQPVGQGHCLSTAACPSVVGNHTDRGGQSFPSRCVAESRTETAALYKGGDSPMGLAEAPPGPWAVCEVEG